MTSGVLGGVRSNGLFVVSGLAKESGVHFGPTKSPQGLLIVIRDIGMNGGFPRAGRVVVDAIPD